MDDRRFDHLSRGIAAAGSRRAFAQVAAALAAAVLPAVLTEEPTAARKRKRTGVSAEHWKHKKAKYCVDGKTVKRYRRQQDTLLAQGATIGPCQPIACVADSLATTCAGKCGNVKNNCGDTVNCGSCVCDPDCEICRTCDAATGTCVADPSQEGDVCNEIGHCVNGECICEPLTCADQGITCGTAGDGCGGQLQCGDCGSGTSCCGDLGTCINTATDPNNCGSCGFVCSFGQVCLNSTCASG